MQKLSGNKQKNNCHTYNIICMECGNKTMVKSSFLDDACVIKEIDCSYCGKILKKKGTVFVKPPE